MVCQTVRNELLPILDKKVLVDGKIPSGRQAEECIEELRALYKQFVDQDGYKPTSGDEDVEGEGGIKSSNLEDFHPPMSSTSRVNMDPLSSGEQVTCTFSKMRRTCRMLSQMALAAGPSFAATNARKKPMLLALRKKRPSATRYLSTRTTVLVRWAPLFPAAASRPMR